ncbi:MAG TPA: hypothetical protein PKI97_05745, partial [Smithellaceae bacterium]|nr:hypothetical protein [Smithellaceae bacterium]HOG81859.1 hypothetical protein [Smithellaceae bacterium]
MYKKNAGQVVFVVMFIILMVSGIAAAQSAGRNDGASNSGEACYKCHFQIKSLKEGSKHAMLSCAVCHSGTKEHVQSFRNKPVTAIDQAVCGKCHGNQLNSFMRINYS